VAQQAGDNKCDYSHCLAAPDRGETRGRKPPVREGLFANRPQAVMAASSDRSRQGHRSADVDGGKSTIGFLLLRATEDKHFRPGRRCQKGVPTSQTSKRPSKASGTVIKM